MTCLRCFKRVLPAVLAAFQLALTASLAGASITPAARAVVDRYVESIGGRAAVDGQRTLFVTGALSAFGMNGRTETLI